MAEGKRLQYGQSDISSRLENALQQLPGITNVVVHQAADGRISSIDIVSTDSGPSSAVLQTVQAMAGALDIELDPSDIGVEQTWRRQRLTKSDVRNQVLSAANAIIEERGLPVGVEEDVSFEVLIQAAKVPRTSAYRVWPDKRAFICDVATRAAEHWGRQARGLAVGLGRSFHNANRVIREEHGRLERGTPEDRRAVLARLIWLTAKWELERALGSPAFKCYIGLSATAFCSADPELSTAVTEALTQAEGRFLKVVIKSYQRLASELGFRLKPTKEPYFDEATRWNQFASAVQALLDGLTLQAHCNPLALDTVPVSGAETNGSVEWSLYGEGLLALVDRFFEPLPHRLLAKRESGH